MTLTYEKLDYQEDALSSVIDTLSGHDDTMNAIELDFDSLVDSVKVTLSANNQSYTDSWLPSDDDFDNWFPQFNIEMETGTGKTMVYLKTIMELHRRFGENKFIIVVPSKAIKAGTEYSLNELRDYLADVHNTDKYHSFVYDSKRINELQNFDGNSFEIMLTTVQAFNRNTNVINQENEGLWSDKPIEIVQNAHPIVIIDEPQSVDASKGGKEAIKSLQPKLALRYSATHKDKQYPLLYEFGPVQAYQANMVKHIETLGTDIDTDGNIPTIELKSVEFKAGVMQAKVVAYAATEDDFDKKTFTLKNGDSLAKKTKNDRYAELGKVTGGDSIEKFIEFENNLRVTVGQVDGENKVWLTAQMTALVRDHLDRELKLQSQGIKVLSLIFLDAVKNYRVYTDAGEQVNGEYATLFEQIYTSVLHSDVKYEKLNDYDVAVSEVHDGYFSQDKATTKKPAMYKDSKGDGDTAADESAYETIMMDKEGLLTQYVPSKPATNNKAAKLRFIFSHSALKEGWDNPNVFQILTIAEPKNELTRRQKIGRGLRIPVNQAGQRVYNAEQNVVTIYANESFEEFASGLQQEYIDAGVLSNKIDADFFFGTLVDKSGSNEEIETDDNGIENDVVSELDDKQRVEQMQPITKNESVVIFETLKESEILKDDGSYSRKQAQSISKPEIQQAVVQTMVEKGIDNKTAQTAVDKLRVRIIGPVPTNRHQRKTVELTDKHNQYFSDLWHQIAHKVNYHVRFDESELIDDIVNGDNPIKNIQIDQMTAVQTRARVKLVDNAVTSDVTKQNTEHVMWPDLPIVDITKQIADKVGLTRRAVIQIIKRSNEAGNQLVEDDEFLNKIKQNPALFVRRAINNIQIHQRKLLNKSLVYVQTGELWPESELRSFDAAGNTLWQVPDRGFEKTLFKQIATDSNEEKNFAEQLVNEEKIKYFLKLPNWFKIPTPFGNYNPDWAILAESNSTSRLYFVVDTKSTTEMGNLAAKEQDRINAGRQAYSSNDENPVVVRFQAPVKVIGNLEI